MLLSGENLVVITTALASTYSIGAPLAVLSNTRDPNDREESNSDINMDRPLSLASVISVSSLLISSSIKFTSNEDIPIAAPTAKRPRSAGVPPPRGTRLSRIGPGTPKALKRAPNVVTLVLGTTKRTLVIGAKTFTKKVSDFKTYLKTSAIAKAYKKYLNLVKIKDKILRATLNE